MTLPKNPPQLKPNRQKILEVLLFLLHEAAEKGARPTQYELVKSVFIADYEHMNKYGRPITYDNHVAMEHGPVPSFTYDVLKPGFNWPVVFGLPVAPWKCELLPNRKSIEYFEPSRKPNIRLLSESDRVSLSSALDQVLKMGFRGVRDWTHELPAYQKAWADRGKKDAAPMSLRLLLKSEDPDEVADLVFSSQHLA